MEDPLFILQLVAFAGFSIIVVSLWIAIIHRILDEWRRDKELAMQWLLVMILLAVIYSSVAQRTYADTVLITHFIELLGRVL